MAYTISKLTISPIIRLWLRKISGLGNIPEDMPFIIAANHSSYYETLLVPSVILLKVNKRIHAFVDSSYWNIFFTRFFLDLWGSIPVYVNKEKNAKKKNKASMEIASNYLKKGHIMMLFPEGQRSYDGKLKKAYNGAARLALLSKVPVLPIGVIGSNEVLPKGKFFLRFKRCEVKIGKLIYFNKYYNKKINDKNLGQFTRIIMKEIAKLIGQKYNY